MLLGVDGGGTKTDVVVADVEGRTSSTARVGCTNHETVGMDRAMAELHAGVQAALVAASATTADVSAAVFGLAGVDWPSDERAVDDAVARFGFVGRRLVVNDSRIALAAGVTDGWGIVSSIGTGAVTAGVDRDGTWFRTMAVGWGEPCGAASLVADALHAVAAQHHLTGPATRLTERILRAFDVGDVPALFEGISRKRLVPDGRLAPLLQLCADDGDEVAIDLLDRSGTSHAAMVVGVAAHLGLHDDTFELVTSGGVHAAGGRFVDAFVAQVHSACARATIVRLETPPVTGAIVLARRLHADGQTKSSSSTRRVIRQ